MRIVWGLILAFTVMVAGFWPSFFSNPGQLDWLHRSHGILASGWMLMLIVQAWLMAKGHLRLHHWVGRLSILWVAALLYTAVKIVIYGLSATGPHALPIFIRPTLAMIDLPSLALFAVLYIAAIWCAFRRSVDLHYRFMISTVIVVIIPALGRFFAMYVPGIQGLPGALHPSFWTSEAVCVALIVYDFAVYRKTYAPYWLTLVSLAIIEALMFHAADIQPFMRVLYALGLPVTA